MRGYKKCFSEDLKRFVLVELEIPDDATWMTPKYEDPFTFRHFSIKDNDKFNVNISKKSRASHAYVVKIHGEEKIAYSLHNQRFKYKVGETVRPEEQFDNCSDYVCGSGIHFFLDKEKAKTYANDALFFLTSSSFISISTAVEDKEEEND